MQLTKECSYGLRVAISLARLKKDIGVKELAKQQNVAPGYLAKIIANLIREDIVTPTGPNRIRLAVDANEVTLADIVSAYGPALPQHSCLMDDGVIHPCDRESDCQLCDLWENVQKEVLKTLSHHTLAEFARCAGPSGLFDDIA